LSQTAPQPARQAYHPCGKRGGYAVRRWYEKGRRRRKTDGRGKNYGRRDKVKGKGIRQRGKAKG